MPIGACGLAPILAFLGHRHRVWSIHDVTIHSTVRKHEHALWPLQHLTFRYRHRLGGSALERGTSRGTTVPRPCNLGESGQGNGDYGTSSGIDQVGASTCFALSSSSGFKNAPSSRAFARRPRRIASAHAQHNRRGTRCRSGPAVGHLDRRRAEVRCH
jgi:hypothetical protein